MSGPNPARDCGDCTVCCEYMPIKVLAKSAFTPCANLVSPLKECENCTIYAERPKVCREYSCMWVVGHGDDEDRPDRCDVLVDSMIPAANALRGVPLSKDAQDTDRGSAALKRISRSADTPVLVPEFGETRLLCVVGRGS